MNNYRPFFRFPELTYTLPVWLPAAAVSASFIAAAGRACGRSPGSSPQTGGGHAPAGPRHLRPRTGRHEAAPHRKNGHARYSGRPVRSFLTVVGIALAVPMVVLGLFWWDALRHMVEVQFDGIERGDASVTFTDPVSGAQSGRSGGFPECLRWRDGSSRCACGLGIGPIGLDSPGLPKNRNSACPGTAT